MAFLSCPLVSGLRAVEDTRSIFRVRNRLYKANVQVLTVKPGFVATKMTEGMDLPEKLTAQPEEVANDIFQAQKKGKNILYTKVDVAVDYVDY